MCQKVKWLMRNQAHSFYMTFLPEYFGGSPFQKRFAVFFCTATFIFTWLQLKVKHAHVKNKNFGEQT